MKLYDLKRGDKFTLLEEPSVPPASSPAQDKTYRFDHVDGMYSYITDEDGKVYHFAAWTEVQPVGDGE